MGKADSNVEWLLRADDTERPVPVSARMVMDDEFWRASIERFDLSAGLRIFLTSADVRRGFVFDTHQSEPEPWLLGHIPISGSAYLGFADDTGLEIGPARSAIFQPAERRGIFTLPPQRGLRHAGYSVRGDRVRRMFGEDLPDTIAAMIGDYGPTRLRETGTTTRMRRLAASLFSSRLRGPLRLIFMEGVALQLLAIQAAAGVRKRRPGTLSARQRRVLEDARVQLLADMADPPGLAVLAARAGMSEQALNAGFRRLYGRTVFEALRDARLDHARIALETRDASIKQIAHRVGYNHVSNFTAAFTRRYGMPPLRYQRGRQGTEIGD